MNPIDRLHALLVALDPNAPIFLAAVIAGGIVRLIRAKLPSLWTWFESVGPSSKPLSLAFQALPSAAITTFLTAGGGGDSWQAVKAAVVGLIVPPLAHHFLKASPLPYSGAQGSSVKLPPPAALLVLCLLCLVGCTHQPTPEDVPSPERVTCYEAARKEFREASELCETDGCIDALSVTQKEQLGACPK